MSDKARNALADALAELGLHQDAQAIRDEMDWPRVDAAIEVINAALRTAPAIDLGQFRDAVEALYESKEARWDNGEAVGIDFLVEAKAERDRLLSLIDSQCTASAVPDGLLLVDRGAFQMVLNVLRRAGKHEIADEFVTSTERAMIAAAQEDE